jgi:hypothetical protein
MPIRLYDIAVQHADDAKSLLMKAKALGFQVRVPSSSLDKITAEALELAVYGQAVAVRFDTPPKAARVTSATPSGSQGRIVQLRSLICKIRKLLGKAGQNEILEQRAKVLAHLLAVSRSKDWANPEPPEWKETEALIGELANLGIIVEIKELPRKNVVSQTQTPKVRRPVHVRGRKKRKSRKTRKRKRRPRLIFTAFESSRRHH